MELQLVVAEAGKARALGHRWAACSLRKRQEYQDHRRLRGLVAGDCCVVVKFRRRSLKSGNQCTVTCCYVESDFSSCFFFVFISTVLIRVFSCPKKESFSLQDGLASGVVIRFSSVNLSSLSFLSSDSRVAMRLESSSFIDTLYLHTVKRNTFLYMSVRFLQIGLSLGPKSLFIYASALLLTVLIFL